VSQLPEFIQALLIPETYPHPVGDIKLMQTQMSYVFLTGDFVYKVKKPVDLGYLDYTTLEKRLYYCQREVELNKRLCPDAYLGVVTINNDNGTFSIDGKGEIEEYAVKMRYLPQERMLNVLLAQNKVSVDMITGIARILAYFHKEAEIIKGFGTPDTIRINTDENFSQTEKYVGQSISKETYRCIKDYTEDFIEHNTSLFNKRIEEGKIRDCHGDLHAAHICFTDNICIYDCIEFNDRFRYCDIAAEVAFLSMDLDHNNRPDLADNFVNAYTEFSNDKELSQLHSFYKCYFAYVRGKVACFQLDDVHIPDEEKTGILANARSYFELAVSYL
jgi:aminoglycoside phosphotransferase family enzyme